MKDFKKGQWILISVLCGSTLGCATITGEKFQPVQVAVQSEEGALVDGAYCRLSNDSGQWKTTTPDAVSVRKSSKDLRVTCEKEGYGIGTTIMASAANMGMYGNILFGGPIGAIIDHQNGTGYNYPDSIPVEMGKEMNLQKVPKARQIAKAPEANTAL